MTAKRMLDAEEEMRDSGAGRFGLDLWRVGGDGAESLEDRRARGANGVAVDGQVPEMMILQDNSLVTEARRSKKRR